MSDTSIQHASINSPTLMVMMLSVLKRVSDIDQTQPR